MGDRRSNEIPKRLRAWLDKARGRGGKLLSNPSLKKLGGSLKTRIPKKFKNLDFNLREVELKNVSQYSGWIRWGLLILALFLLAEMTSGVIGLFIRPTPQPIARRGGGGQTLAPSVPTEDYDAILRRNMFNVEGKIPDAFDQGQLDCFSQARASTQRLVLLGTIVMNDERHSVALLQDEGNPVKMGVKKDEVFSDGKYQAMKVERKKFCFMVKSTQELEFIEIPEDNINLGMNAPSLEGKAVTDGITPVTENDYVVKQNFLEKNLLNLNDILQTARAVPYVEPGTGKFRGFLIQSIEANSPFAALGVRQGDILTGVNDIVLDNAGKGLEAFQRLRNSQKINLKLIRGGSETSLNYDVK